VHVQAAIDEVLGRPRRAAIRCRHDAPGTFFPGRDLELTLSVQEPASPSSVRIHYRHVNQAERYEVADMRPYGGAYRATIPAAYTGGRFPLQYYFELRPDPGVALLYPGFMPDLANVPYFVVRQAR
jgi:hypothetical protein